MELGREIWKWEGRDKELKRREKELGRVRRNWEG